MRGKDGDIRFEYDGEGTENKGAETLQHAILNSNSDDAVHKYHNHGEAIILALLMMLKMVQLSIQIRILYHKHKLLHQC